MRNDGTPYYIGKGTGYRAWSKDHAVPRPHNKDHIIILENNLSNIGACALERRYIAWYGRKDKGTGILRNQTDGGEGHDGATQTPQRIKAQQLATKAAKLATTGKPQTKEHIEKRTKKQKQPIIIDGVYYNSKRHAANSLNISESELAGLQGSFSFTDIRKPTGRDKRVTCPHCNKVGQIQAMKRWHFDNCKKVHYE